MIPKTKTDFRARVMIASVFLLLPLIISAPAQSYSID